MVIFLEVIMTIQTDIQCPCCKKVTMEASCETEEIWYGGTPFPDEKYTLFCPDCGYNTDIMAWEYARLARNNQSLNIGRAEKSPAS